MVYMQVIQKTVHELHLARSPASRSWAVFADGWHWGLLYSCGCLFIAIQTLESWEVRDDNKTMAYSLKIKVKTSCQSMFLT
uniref:Essential for reactive oxygen species protein n=1 Tax=Eptatretus burgeri TaxID=7764 RepID=A0A8C4WV12_EPTBU